MWIFAAMPVSWRSNAAMTHHARLNLTGCRVEHGPMGTFRLVALAAATRERFSAQVFASHGTAFADTATAWTSAGKVRCVGGIEFPGAANG